MASTEGCQDGWVTCQGFLFSRLAFVESWQHCKSFAGPLLLLRQETFVDQSSNVESEYRAESFHAVIESKKMTRESQRWIQACVAAVLMWPFTYNNSSFEKEGAILNVQTSQDRGGSCGIASYLTVARISHMWRCSKHSLNISLWSLCCGRLCFHSWHEHKGKIAEPRNPCRCSTCRLLCCGVLTPSLQPLVPSVLPDVLRLTAWVCLFGWAQREKMCGSSRRRLSSHPHIPEPGCEELTYTRTVLAALRNIGATFAALSHEGIRQKVGHGASVTKKNKTLTSLAAAWWLFIFFLVW